MARANDIRHDARQLRVVVATRRRSTRNVILVLNAREDAVVHAKVSIVGNGFVLFELNFRGRSMKGTRDGDGLGVLMMMLLLFCIMVKIRLHGRHW